MTLSTKGKLKEKNRTGPERGAVPCANYFSNSGATPAVEVKASVRSDLLIGALAKYRARDN
jgi:hypothetical protein